MDTQPTDPQLQRRRKRRRGIVALLGAVSVLTIGAGTISLAQFTDSDSFDLVLHDRHDRRQLNPAVLASDQRK